VDSVSSGFVSHRQGPDHRVHSGLGFGLVRVLSARDNVIVFAGARDPTAAKDLQALAAERAGKLYVVKLVSNDAEGNTAAVSFIKEKAGRLDVVIANSGQWMRVTDFVARFEI
jgi:NAD(P)-dependent dehydrogenase (short-subunit alcohol dehydrogenase family)